MQHKNFFNARYFSPIACRVFSKFSKSQGNILFRMYESNSIVEFDVPNYQIFLPQSILSDGKFGKIQGEKRIILQLNLSEEALTELIKALGGTLKKRKNPPHSPTLGDLLK